MPGRRGTKELWQEVFDFITESYDEEVLEKIYINGDGADWIRTGAGMHAKARFVLDRFHMHKYIISATSHLKDSHGMREVKYTELLTESGNGRQKKHLIRFCM
ncbi:MAG: UPF0236 family transposase-like protein [Clostridium sp.]